MIIATVNQQSLAPVFLARSLSLSLLVTATASNIRLTTSLTNELRFANDNVVRDGLAHIVQCQGCNRTTGQRLHLDTGLVCDLDDAIDLDRVALSAKVDRDLAALDCDWMAEWNQVARVLDTQRSGNDGRCKHRTFGCGNVVLRIVEQRRNWSWQMHHAACMCCAHRGLFVADIDHARQAIIAANVRQTRAAHITAKGVVVGSSRVRRCTLHQLLVVVRRCSSRYYKKWQPTLQTRLPRASTTTKTRSVGRLDYNSTKQVPNRERERELQKYLIKQQ
jgi:hypothetical protein